MTHTPGPWEIIGREKSVSFVRGECLLVTVDHREDFGESAPDAILIAAAPELLAACKLAKKFLEPDLVEPGRTVFWKLVEAIAKAEGHDANANV